MDGFQSLDPVSAKIYNQIMDRQLEYNKRFIMRCYTDRELLETYEALRNAYMVEQSISKSSMREIYRPPHPIVARFIDWEMNKKYGEGWKWDKKTFRMVCKTEELIEPWLVVPRRKI